MRHRPVRRALPSPARRGRSTSRRPSSSASSSRPRTATPRSMRRSRRWSRSSRDDAARVFDAICDGRERGERPLGARTAPGRARAVVRGGVLDRSFPSPRSLSGSRRSTRAISSTTGGRVSSPHPTRTSRSCSATRSSPTGSCTSPRWATLPPSRDLADLLSLCAQTRAEGRAGDGEAWAATAAYLGLGGLGEARAAFREAGDPAPSARPRDGCGPAAEAALARSAWRHVPLP